MPKREDIRKIMLIGSGPIIIGQACEFDYSGSQACKAIREEGYQVVLINSNPATIMTDPQMADATYIEPIVPEVVEKILEIEKPDALLPTLGGQSGLNVAAELSRNGALERHGVELIGAKFEAIEMAEDRLAFKEAMERIGMEMPSSACVGTVENALSFAESVGYPIVIRPSYTLGGSGGGIAYNVDELKEISARGIDLSPVSEVLVEQSVIGWKEYELEVMRDTADNVVIICSIENMDPMGVHTGDSITVAPAQTLTDREYQHMRDASIKIIREIGVETGGSNIQFAVDPKDGRMMVIEMNPRVSRSSALASKATGFPIAKMAAKLAVGLTLDEIPNDITRKTPACFEPTIDYCVVKIPRWDFAKFQGADSTLTTQMKAVGEVMAVGRTFKEALQKGLRSLELNMTGLGCDAADDFERIRRFADPEAEVKKRLVTPCADRILYLRYAVRLGMDRDELHRLTGIDPWFLKNIAQIVEMEDQLRIAAESCAEKPLGGLERRALRKAKIYGFSDFQLGRIFGTTEDRVRALRKEAGVPATFKLVDTCAAEFEAYTPYYYSTHESECESRASDRRKVMILGGGPNRIGQGIEFDYCCVQAAFALKEEDCEVIMVNCNPETVSTDYDTSDKLYFEPLTLENVLNICDVEKPDGVVVQFGGQTPLKLAIPLKERGVNVLGTSPEDIDSAEDRELFADLIERLGLKQAPNGTARSFGEAVEIARRLGYPVLVRPSYVLGGRAMEIVYDDESLETYMHTAVMASPDHPVLIDKFLEASIEVDVDAICDGTRTVVGGIMEHIEEAGIHSGDSCCSLPPFSLSEDIQNRLREITGKIAREMSVCGLLNIQFALKENEIYVLEVNPRASRTVPFVGKVTGLPVAKIAAKVMAGRTLDELRVPDQLEIAHIAVKAPVFPFAKFPGVDVILGPEMRSTGEVMGVDSSFGSAFAKAYLGAGETLPTEGTAFVSVADRDKRAAIPIARGLSDLGFRIVSTRGTAAILRRSGIPVETAQKLGEGRPNVTDFIRNGEMDVIFNTPIGKGPRFDEYRIRRLALEHGIPIVTTLSGAVAALEGIRALRSGNLTTKPIQEYIAGTSPVNQGRS